MKNNLLIYIGVFLVCSTLAYAQSVEKADLITDKRTDYVHPAPGEIFCVNRTVAAGTTVIPKWSGSLTLLSIDKVTYKNETYDIQTPIRGTCSYIEQYDYNNETHETPIDDKTCAEIKECAWDDKASTCICNRTIDYSCTTGYLTTQSTRLVPIYTPIKNTDTSKDSVYTEVEKALSTDTKELLYEGKSTNASGLTRFCFKSPDWNNRDTKGEISYIVYNDTNYDICESTWWDATYSWRLPINCSNIAKTAIPIIINGTGGFSVNGTQTWIWTTCSGENMSIYFNSASNLTLANDSGVVPFEVEKGSATSNNPTSVWGAEYKLVLHGDSIQYGNDSTSFGNDGLCDVGTCPETMTGFIGDSFNTSGDGMWVLYSASSMGFSSYITLEFIAKRTSNSPNTQCVVKSRNSARGFMMYLDEAGVGYNNMSIFYTGGSSWGGAESADQTVKKDVWNILVSTYDVNVGRRIYSNGTLIKSDSIVNQFTTSQVDWYLFSNDAMGTDGFVGQIDELRILNVTRTSTEINQTKDNYGKVAGYGNLLPQEQAPVGGATVVENSTNVTIHSISGKANNSMVYTKTPEVQFNVTGTNATYLCDVVINNSVNAGRNGAVANNTRTNITINISLYDKNYTFIVNCTGNITNKSGEWNITINASAMNISRINQTPTDILENSTDRFVVNFQANSTYPINTSKCALTRTVYDSIFNDYYWQFRIPANNKSEQVAGYDGLGKIFRADNRNQNAWYETEAFVEGNIWKWGVTDITNIRVGITGNADNTSINFTYNGSVQDSVFPAVWYLDRTDMESENKSPIEIYLNRPVLLIRQRGVIRDNYTAHFLAYVNYSGTAPTNPLRLWVCNTSYNITGGISHTASPNCGEIGSWNSTSVRDYVMSARNSSYAEIIFPVNSSKVAGVRLMSTNYFILSSSTPPSRPYVIMTANGSTTTNTTFAQTLSFYSSTNNGGSWTLQPRTGDVWISRIDAGKQLQYKLYCYDNTGDLFNSTLYTDDIGQVFYPPSITTVLFVYTNFGGEDFTINDTYNNNLTLRFLPGLDPDGGNVTSNASLVYTSNLSIAGVINSSFGQDGLGINITYNSSNVPDDQYMILMVAKDNENNVSSHYSPAFRIDNTAPITTYSMNKSNGATYTNNTWTNLTVNVTFICSDASIGCNMTMWCNDTTNTCTPTAEYSGNINITNNATTYLRYYSNDSVGNNETTRVLIIKIDMLNPNIKRQNQTPQNITSLNITTTLTANISYNATDSLSDGDNSTWVIYFKTNNTLNDCIGHTNGTLRCGWSSQNASSSNKNESNFTMGENDVYPTNELLDYSTYFQYTNKSGIKLNTTSSYFKVAFVNITANATYSFLELMTNATSNASIPIYFCNSSYTTGSPLTSSSCALLYTIYNHTAYNHSHTENSSHHIIPFPINSTTNKSQGILVTNTSYFLIRGKSTSITIWGVNNITTTTTSALSTDIGATWTNQAFTPDAHLHQYTGNETFRYYVCLNDTAGNHNCSTESYDTIDTDNIPPSSPIVSVPLAINYFSDQDINITYSRPESPNGNPLRVYNISILYQNESFYKSIQPNNSLYTNFTWNWDANVTQGLYYIKVEACDNNSMCSFGLSEIFQLSSGTSGGGSSGGGGGGAGGYTPPSNASLEDYDYFLLTPRSTDDNPAKAIVSSTCAEYTITSRNPNYKLTVDLILIGQNYTLKDGTEISSAAYIYTDADHLQIEPLQSANFKVCGNPLKGEDRIFNARVIVSSFDHYEYIDVEIRPPQDLLTQIIEFLNIPLWETPVGVVKVWAILSMVGLLGGYILFSKKKQPLPQWRM